MNKKYLQCQYCKSLITENDIICPKCGANCSEVIKEYKDAKEEEQRIAKEKIEAKQQEIFKRIEKSQKIVKIPFFIIFGIAFIFIITMILKSTGIIHPIRKELSGTLKETISTEKYNIFLDKYEAYEYYDDFFKDCNTKKGYQKIAFHFIIENKSNANITSRDILKNVKLKAGDEETDSAKLSTSENFCQVIQGKASYNELNDNTTIIPKDKLSGYLGFEIPKSEKSIKFIINDSNVIEIKNPAYKK